MAPKFCNTHRFNLSGCEPHGKMATTVWIENSGGRTDPAATARPQKTSAAPQAQQQPGLGSGRLCFWGCEWLTLLVIFLVVYALAYFNHEKKDPYPDHIPDRQESQTGNTSLAETVTQFPSTESQESTPAVKDSEEEPPEEPAMGPGRGPAKDIADDDEDLNQNSTSTSPPDKTTTGESDQSEAPLTEEPATDDPGPKYNDYDKGYAVKDPFESFAWITDVAFDN